MNTRLRYYIASSFWICIRFSNAYRKTGVFATEIRSATVGMLANNKCAAAAPSDTRTMEYVALSLSALDAHTTVCSSCYWSGVSMELPIRPML